MQLSYTATLHRRAWVPYHWVELLGYSIGEGWVTSLGVGWEVESHSLWSSSLLRKGQVPYRLLGACLLVGVQVCS